ncbi:MAG: gliding motility-associated C-terminal domain-containing protein [Bacteroidota bacterium]
MKNLFALLLCLVLAGSKTAYSQCTVQAFASPKEILCGDTVSLSAAGSGISVFKNTFDACAIGTGWAATSQARFDNPCGASKDGTCYLWMGNTSAAPRNATTNAFDLSTGGTVCFWMKYAAQGGASPCEGPDLTDEGVYIEYSTNGTTWTTIEYYNPNGGNDPQRTNWNQYCVNIPPGAMTTTTRIRWIQKSSSNLDSDHWGIDDVEIVVNPPAATYKWAHIGIEQPTATTPAVQPVSNTSYTVEYKFGGCTAVSTVNVVVRKPSLSVTAAPGGTVCPGQAVVLTAVSELQDKTPVCGATPSTACSGLGSQPQERTVGTGNIINTYNGGGSGVNVFGDFGPTNANSRMQILYRASELQALGMTRGGKISSIAFDIAQIRDAGSYTDFSIYIGCSSKTTMAANENLANLTQVYGPRTQAITTGWNTFNFTQGYNWDGVSNLVVQVCWTVASSSVSLCAFTRDHATGFVSVLQGVNNTFNYTPNVCSTGTTFQSSASQRPNTRFGTCEPKNIPLEYTWTPNVNIAPTNQVQATANPTATQTYTVKVNGVGMPTACAVSSNYTINVFNLAPVDAQFDPVCTGSPLQLKAVTSGSLTGLIISWTGPGGWTSNVQNPIRTPAVAGKYTVTFSSGPGGGNCSVTDDVDVVLDTPPSAGTGYTAGICESNAAYNLFTLLTGAPKPGGTWTSSTGYIPSGTAGLTGGNNLDASVLTVVPGTYKFTYTVTNNNACGPRTSEVTINVVKGAFAGKDSTITLCNSGTTVALFNQLAHKVTGAAADAGGVWSDINTPVVGARFTAATGTFNIAGIAGGTYKFKYKVTGTAPCVADSAVVTVLVDAPPVPGVNYAETICQTNNAYNLITGLGATAQAGGTWTSTTGYTPSGTAGLSGGTLNATALTTVPGTYKFTYTVTNNNSCGTRSAEATITVEKAPFAGRDSTFASCNNTTVTLFPKLGRSFSGQAPDAGGTWTDVSTAPVGPRFNAAAGSVDVNGLTPGTYAFRYTVAATSKCPAHTATVTVTVISNPKTGNGGMISICNDAGAIDLYTVISGAYDAGGNWTSVGPLGGGSLSGSNFNPFNSGATTYKFRYQINVTGCPVSQNDVDVTVNRRPNAGRNGNLTICETAAPVDLRTILTGTPQPGGNYTDLATGSAVASPFAVSGKGGNTYTIEYRIAGIGACPDSAATATLVVIKQPLAGNDVSSKICFNVKSPVDLFSLITGAPQTGGTWSKRGTFNGTLNASTGEYTLSGNESDTGTVNFMYILTATAPCKNDTAFVALRVNGAPHLSNVVSSCAANRTTFSSTLTLTGGDRTTYTVTPSGGSISGSAPAYTYTSAAFASGTSHLITVSDGNGCASDTVTVFRDCSCTTQPGTMADSPQSVCAGGSTAAGLFNNDNTDDGNDRVSFYLHEGSGTSLVNVKAVSNTTVFGFNAATMQYGTTYYISSGSGNDSSGFAQRGDVCFSISSGTPVVFHPLPMATLSGSKNICPGNSAYLVFTATVGTAPFEIDIFNADVTPSSGTATYTLNGALDSVQVGPGDTTYYQLRRIKDSFGCESTFATNTQVAINVNEAPRATIAVATACSNGGTNPGSFTITTTGAGSVFNVSYDNSVNSTVVPLTLPLGTTTITPTAYDPNVAVSYHITALSDNSGSVCPPVFSTVPAIIYPVPTAVLSGNQVICTSNRAKFNFTLTGVAPWTVVITDGVNNHTFTSSNRNFVDSIANPGAGVHTYSIVSVTSNAGPSCVGTGTGSAVVRVNSVPSVALFIENTATSTRVKNDRYCEGDGPRNLAFDLAAGSGYGNRFNVGYTIDGTPQSIVVDRPGGLRIVDPLLPGTHTYTITSITDTSSAQCPGTGDVATIIINARPTLTINSAPAVVCQGSPVSVQVTVQGPSPVTFTVQPTGSGDNTVYPAFGPYAAGNHTITLTPNGTGNVTYAFGSLIDNNTPTCSGTITPNTVTVRVNPAPVAAMSKPSVELCSGEPLELTYSLTGAPGATVTANFSSQGGPTYTVKTGDANPFVIQNLAPGDYVFGFIAGSIADNSSCPGTPGAVTTVKVRPVPNMSIAFDKDVICQGESAKLLLTAVSGTGLMATYSVNGVAQSPVAVPGVIDITSAQADQRFHFTLVTDNSTSSYSLGVCRATIDLKDTLHVNPLPAGYLSGVREACKGTTDSVMVTITTGNPPFTASFSDNNGLTYPAYTNLKLGANLLRIAGAPSDSLVFSNLKITDSSLPGACSSLPEASVAYLNINPVPAPVFNTDKKGGCSPLDIKFDYVPELTYTAASCVWDFDDKTVLSACADTAHTFTEPGIYNIVLTVTSQQGCSGKTTRSVVVYPDPIAAFSWEPEPVTLTNSFVRFFNESFGGASYEWNIDNLYQFDTYAPTVQLPAEDTATYNISLKVTTGFGCVDSICKPLKVQGELLINIPNSFSPNGDAFNEVWIPVALGYKPEVYSLTVFDRWGQPVFHTTDPEEGWNGKDRQNEMCAVGTYAYRLTMKSKYSGEKVSKIGNINLLR